MASNLKFANLPGLFTKMFNVTKGATFAQLYVETVPDLPRKSMFFKRVTKKQCHNVQLNFNYSNAINNIRMEEGKDPDFVPSAPKWGTRVPGTPLIFHTKKGETESTAYLMTRILKTSNTQYFLDGKFVDSIPLLEAIMSDIPIPSSGKAHQGNDKEVIVRTFKLNSIRAITMDGETLVVEK